MNRALMVVMFIAAVIVSGAAFPICNFGKEYPGALTGITLYLNVFFYLELGWFEKRGWKLRRLSSAVLINIGIILSGMLFRYLLEWGEVSNTYNFTAPNMLFHIVVSFGISTLAYLLMKNQRV